MKRNIIRAISLTLCVLTVLVCLGACASKFPLVGTWSANEAEGCSYVFKEDGTGMWHMDEIDMNFKYVIKDNTVEITYDGVETTGIWEFEIKGNDLTMTDTDTETVLTYTKQ